MKRFFTVIFFLAAYSIYSIDLAVISYLPSAWGRVAGNNVVWNRFKGREEVEAISIPVEVKCAVVFSDFLVLSAIAGYSFYVEDEFEGFASHNVSFGFSISAPHETFGETTGLAGFYTSVYPLYEFPVATYGKDPLASWKIALDTGYGINMGMEGSGIYIYINGYMRTVGVFASTGGTTKFFLNLPDFGIALGFHVLQN
jgi:hypothetical protein